MKKLFVTIAAIAIVVGKISAQDYYLYVETDQKQTGFELASLQKITLDNGCFIITKKDGTLAQSTPQSEMQKMYFSTTPVGINEASISSKNQELGVKDEIYDLTGRKVSATPMKSIAPGLVIVNGKKYLNK